MQAKKTHALVKVELSTCKGKPRRKPVWVMRYVLPSGKAGEPICGSGLYRRFLNASKRAGLPVLRLHDLRHTFGTQAIRGFKIHEVQRLMGHRHITTRYLHYAPDADAADRLSALWETAVGETPLPASAEAANVVLLHRAA